MILGLSIPAFTLLHVLISVAGIGSGAIVVAGMLAGRKLVFWNVIFLATSIATSVTGFFFPFTRFDAADAVGIISLAVLALALFALYGRRLAGPWRLVYTVSALVVLYLNVFVAIAQAFQKVPVLHALAPAQSEPPFLTAQIAVLATFIILGFLATRRSRREMLP